MTGTTDDRDESGQQTPGGHAAARLREQLARELGEVPPENPPDATASQSGEPETDQESTDTPDEPEAGPQRQSDDGPDGDRSG